MHDTIAVIQVESLAESTMGDDRTITRMYKVEIPSDPESDVDHEQAALWQYNNGGYGYLESLGTDDPDAAVEEAESRVRDYALDETITDISVTRRD